jgi:DNA-binding MarR family transcriptional regulator
MPYLSQLLAEVSEILTTTQDDDGGRGPLVVLANVGDDVLVDLRAVLERRKSLMAILRGDGIDLVSGRPHLVTTLQAAQEFPATFTAAELAERLEMNPNSINERLQPLYTAGVLSRSADPKAKRGTRYRYRAPRSDLFRRL